MVGLALTAMIAAWLGVFGPIDFTKIEKWQTLIAACVAAVGIGVTAYVAVRNVTKQIRVGILSREEDRIERELPGLRDARNFCAKFVPYKIVQAFFGITQAFIDEGIGVVGSSFQDDVIKALPNTDPATRFRVQGRLGNAFTNASHAQSLMASITRTRENLGGREQWAPGEWDKANAEIERDHKLFAAVSDAYRKSMDEIEAEIADIDRKIALYEARLVRIRKEIEAYFDKDERP